MTPLWVIVAIAVILLVSGLRIAREYRRAVIFRLGRYKGLRGPGLFWIIPMGIERAVIIDIRTRTVSAEQQETITRDSVTIKVNAVLWYRIVDPAKSVIAVSEAPDAVYQLALTSLRNIIGQHDLDDVLRERDKINGLLRENIANSTTQWGVEVERFEMKDVELPEAMQQVMAMQAEAIREKKGADHQGGSRTGSVGEVVSSFGSNGRESGGTRAAADADDRRSGRREQQYSRLNDSFGFRGALEDARRIHA
jgi:regulator of protease activity HflC (stomatin/prohibitin superfamily)